tara:strand:+ start:1953 stop:2174 length:222 start_codon:yes stop_codon:yes gene_type:complete
MIDQALLKLINENPLGLANSFSARSLNSVSLNDAIRRYIQAICTLQVPVNDEKHVMRFLNKMAGFPLQPISKN